MPTSPTKTYDDFISTLSGGEQSGINPLLLQKEQAGFLLNTSLRGGYAHTRAPTVKINLNYAGRDDLQAIVEGGYYQGGGYYRPDSGTESLIAQISGKLLKFTQGNSGWNVTDIGVPGDSNDPTIPQIWMWQAERWMIINDGSGKNPIFYDGVSSRRSYGPSTELGVTADDFFPPPIGDTVDITLTAPYAGPFNVPIILNGAFYQPISFKASGTPFNAILTNLSGTAGTVIPNLVPGSQQFIYSVPSAAGVISVESSFREDNVTIPPGQLVETFTLYSPFLGAIGSQISITGQGNFANGNTHVWIVNSVSGNQITCTNKSSFGVVGFTYNPGVIAHNGYDYKVGTIVNFNGNNSPNVVVGSVALDFTVPALGSTVPIVTFSAYTGPANAVVFIAGIEFSIIYTSPAPPGAIITVLNLTDTTNNPEPQYPTAAFAPQQLLSVPELPPGRMGAYGMGRNWFALIDGISYEAGDIVGGSSGTQAYNFRDAVLKTTENDFLAGGGTFRLPGAGDQITAMVFPPILDASLGQGPLQIFTSVSCFSNNSPVDRTEWEQVTSPILTESLKDNGALAQNSTILINSDTFFRSFVGFGSLVLARRDFGGWGNKSISNEMQRPLLADNQFLLQFGSSVSFDNRFIATAAPNLIGAGVFHVGLCTLNFDLISSLRTTLPPAWEGAWSGINTMQLITGRVTGTNRAFSFTYDLNTNKIELWEMLSESAANQAQIFKDNNDTPILWLFETAVLFNKDIKPLTELCELIDGELYISNVTDTLNVKVYYRPDFYPCWVLWREFNICADDDNATGDGNKQPGYRMRIGLGQPSVEDCEPGNNRPLRQGFFHQFRIEFTGYAIFRGLRVRANSFPLTALATVECEPKPCQLIDCQVPDDLQIYSLQGFIPEPPPQNAPPPGKFKNLQVIFPSVCMAGTPSISVVPPSWITLDAAGNQFIGKPGVFAGQTQDGANSEAQASLNNFVSQNIALGNITCSSHLPSPDEIWYKYPEGSGFVTSDFSPANNEGTDISGWATGPTGGGAISGSVTGHDLSTFSACDFTYSTWVKPTGTGAASFILFECLNFSVESNHHLVLAINSSNELTFMANYPTVIGTSAGIVTFSVWSMISFTYASATGVMNFYINGVPAGTATASASALATSEIFIGGDPVSGHSTFAGDLADSRIWSQALTAQNILDLFNGGAQ